jgi:hypothetical protein
MATYRCRVRSPWSVSDAFDYMADFRNFERWDPGVISSTQVEGDGPGPDAAYDVLTTTGDRENLFHYVVTEFRPPHRAVIVGKRFPFTSIDTVEVAEDPAGSIVTYSAELKVPFPLSLADGWLQRLFDRIGDAAAKGLAGALEGEWLR